MAEYSFSYTDQSDIDEFLTKLATSAIDGVQFTGYIDPETLYNYRAGIRTDILSSTIGVPYYNVSFVDTNGNPINIESFIFGDTSETGSTISNTIYENSKNSTEEVDTGLTDEYGRIIIGYDVDGKPIYGISDTILGYDANGNPIYGYAPDGTPIVGFDELGNPILGVKKPETSSGSDTDGGSDSASSQFAYDEKYFSEVTSTTKYFEDTASLPVPDEAGNTANFEFENNYKNSGVENLVDDIYKETSIEQMERMIKSEQSEWDCEPEEVSRWGVTEIEYFLGLPPGGHLTIDIKPLVQREAVNLATSIQNNMTIADYFANAKSVFISTAMQASGVAQALANIQGLKSQLDGLISGLGNMFTGWDSSNVLNSMDNVLGNAESWITQFDSFIDNSVAAAKYAVGVVSNIIDRVQAGYEAIKDWGKTIGDLGKKIDDFKVLCAEKGFTEAFSQTFLSDSMIQTLSNLPVISDVFNIYNTIKSAFTQIMTIVSGISLPQNLSGIIAIIRSLRAIIAVARNVKDTIMATYNKFKQMYKMIASGQIIGVVMNWAAASLANAIFIGVPPQMPYQYPFTPHYIPPAGGEVAENQKPGSKGGKIDIAPDGSRREVTPEGDIIQQAQGRVQQSSKKALELHSDKSILITASDTLSLKGGNIENVTSGVFSVTAGNVSINGDPATGNAAVNALDTVITGTKSLTLASAPAKGAIELRAGIIKMTADSILWLSAPNILVGNPPGGSAAGKSLPCANIINIAQGSIVRSVGGAGDVMTPAGISMIGAGYIQKLAAVIKLN